MAKIEWDKTGTKAYETGVNQCVLYTATAKTEAAEANPYGKGTAWNGITSISESPEGADASDLYADNIKYATLRATETFKCTIEAYTYPEEFEACDGSATLVDGVTVGQQTRATFGLCYRTECGNDTSTSAGYKLHLVYGCTASPSEKSYSSINDSPDAITFSWEIETIPVNIKTVINGTTLKPTATLIVDSQSVTAEKMEKLEAVLYGSDTAEATLPTPDEVYELLKA